MVLFQTILITQPARRQNFEKGTLLIKDGKVVNVGSSVSIPKNTNIIDVSGKSVYPSFIDIYSDFGIEKPKRQAGRGGSETDQAY